MNTNPMTPPSAGGVAGVLEVLRQMQANSSHYRNGLPVLADHHDGEFERELAAIRAVEAMAEALGEAASLLADQSKLIERYRTSGKCPQEMAVEAVALLSRRNNLLPNHYDDGRIATILAAYRGGAADQGDSR